MRHVISALVMNEPGVLANVAGMFAARGFNIDSLVVGRTEDPNLSRMTIVVTADDATLDQVRKQLAKLVPVVKIHDFAGSAYIERDLALVTVGVGPEQRSEVLEIVTLFRAKVVDVSPNSVVVELAGTEDKIEAFIELMQPYKIHELARTGVIAMSRGMQPAKLAAAAKSGKRRAASMPQYRGPAAELMLASLVLLLTLLLTGALGPGMLIVRWLKWRPREKLVAALAASFICLYLVSFLIYGLNLNIGRERVAHLVVCGLCLGATLICYRDLKRLFARRSVRRMVGAWSIVFGFALLMLALVRHYAGGTWGGDWLEHFQRSTFFLEHAPLDELMINLYPLPSRPPLMNLVAGHFALSVDLPADYLWFQVTFLFLNSLVFLPCALLAGRFGIGGRRPLLLALLFIASPLFLQNVTYTWTKLFTAFFILLALHLYLSGWRKRDPWRMVAAFVTMSAGFLAHFSAGPYALFLGLHYLLFVFWRRPARWREAAIIALASAVLLATWFGWSIHAYGLRHTIASNSTVTDSATMSAGGNVKNIARNLLNTLFPRVLQAPRAVMGLEELDQASNLGKVRDFFFLIYQVSLPFAPGLIGGPLVGYLLVRSLLDGRRARGWFWLLLGLLVIPVGVIVYGGQDRFGVAHITLQPLVLLAITFLAARLPELPRRFQVLALAGCVLDFVLGILLHFHLENYTFRLLTMPDGTYTFPDSPDLPAQAGQYNFFSKEFFKLTFFGDLFAEQSATVEALAAIVFLGLLAYVAFKELKLVPPLARHLQT